MSLLLACIFVLAQAASGAVWWCALRRRTSWVEVIGMGIAMGSVAALLSGVALRPVLGAWGWSVPAAATVVFVLVRPRWIVSRFRLCDLPMSQAVGLVVGVGAGLVVVVANWIRVPLDAVSDGSYTDIYFFEALSRSVTDWGPGPSILMTGGDLPYHWFVYGWSGQLAATAGTPSFVMLTRVLPVVAVIALAALAIAWTTVTVASARSIPRWVPTLAALLVVLAGYPGALYGSIVNFDSPSQTFASMWLLAFGLAVLRYLHGGSRWLLLVIAVLGLSLVGGKVSHAAVAAAGLVVVTVVGALRRAPWVRRSGVVLVVAGVAMVVAYLWVLRGAALDQNLTETLAVRASTWQGLDPLVGRWGPVLGTLGLIAAMLARPAGLLALLGRRPFRDDPAVLWALGGLLAGVGALLVLRGGINETWFLLAASAPAGALSAVGAGELARSLTARGLRRPLVVAIAVTVPVSLVVLAATWNWPIDPESPAPRVIPWFATVAVWILAPLGAWIALRLRGSSMTTGGHAVAALAVIVVVLSTIATRPAALWTTARPVITDIGTVTPVPSAVTGGAQPDAAALASASDRRAVLAWLETAAAQADIVATTRPTSAQIPAETGLRTYLSGQMYQAGLGPAGSAVEVARRAAVLSALGGGEWATAVEELCAAGVTYFWIEGDAPILTPVDPEFSTPSVAVISRAQVC